MKPEEILEKTLKGELSGDALQAEVEKLDVEGQTTLKKLAADSAKTSLAEATGLRKERDRANDLKTQAEKEAEEAAKKAEDVKKAAEAGGEKPPAKDETMSQFRKEQKDKAIARLQSERQLTNEQTAQVVEHFNKIDSGLVDADNIYNELLGAYAFINRDTLLTADAEKRKREQTAAEAEAEAAGGAKGEPSGSNPPKFSEAVVDLSKRASITPEAAQKIATEGTKRVFG